MVMISKIFSNALNTPYSNFHQRHLPMINSVTQGLVNYFGDISQIRKKKALMTWVKTTPELIALMSKVSKDIIWRFHFEPINPKDSGRNKIMIVNKFATQVELRSVMFSQLMDILGVGEGFGWKGFLRESDIKSKLKEYVIGKPFLEIKEKKQLFEDLWIEIKQTEGFASEEDIDEDVLRPRKYRYVPSSTMEVIHDQYDVLKYRHQVGLNDVYFSPEEIIRFTFMEVDGKIGGFTPVESFVVQLELLRQMWQNNLSIHKNGGSPDMVFALENVNPNTQAYQRIEEQLQRYKLVENKHGNLLFTGKLTVHELNNIDEMQFLKSGLYVTSVMAMQWQIPRSSLPFILGEANTKDDTGGNSERGYWTNIDFAQRQFAETMNTQLWMPNFGVKIVFENPFINQVVQEETARMGLLNNIVTMDNILMKNKKQLTIEKKLKMMNLDEEDTEELDESMMLNAAFGTGTQAQLGKAEVNDSDSKKNVKKAKKDEQDNSISSRGVKPTGVG